MVAAWSDDGPHAAAWVGRGEGRTRGAPRSVPRPGRSSADVFEVRPIKWLLEKGTIIIAAGGGGIPTVYEPGRQLRGIEAVIDKDLCSELLARQLEADVFVMATDADAVFTDWGKPTARAFRRASPEAMRGFSFPAGSMGPKVDAACHFAEATGKRAAIGALKDLEGMLRGEAGTTITTAATAIELGV
jgi:carbamate kinase